MISPTQQYKDLIESLKNAKKIIRGVNLISCDTDLQHLKLQAYILLCHAALEVYIEELAIAAAKSARTSFANSGVITKTLLALISSKLVEDLSDKSKAKLCADLASNIEEFSKEAFNRYNSVVKSNNGIVKRDQIKLLVPIGVDPETVDIALMNSLHTFGSKRGDVAHSFRVQRTETLSAVESNLRTIMQSIVNYDQAVCNALDIRMR